MDDNCYCKQQTRQEDAIMAEMRKNHFHADTSYRLYYRTWDPNFNKPNPNHLALNYAGRYLQLRVGVCTDKCLLVDQADEYCISGQ